MKCGKKSKLAESIRKWIGKESFEFGRIYRLLNNKASLPCARMLSYAFRYSYFNLGKKYPFMQLVFRTQI